MAAFAAGFGALAVLRHRAFDSGRFDLGNMTQAVWSTANGDLLSVTDVHGEQISRLGSHFDPILAALAPLWWIWPSPELLLVVQAGAVAAGALPVFWLARAHLDSERTARRPGARVPPLPAGAVADRKRLPPGLARDAAAPLRAGGSSTSGGCCRSRSARPRRSRRRSTSGSTSPRWASGTRSAYRAPRTGAAIAVAAAVGRAARDTRRRPALRPGRCLGVREPLRRTVARRPRPLVPGRAVPAARPAPARGAARAAAGRSPSSG